MEPALKQRLIRPSLLIGASDPNWISPFLRKARRETPILGEEKKSTFHGKIRHAVNVMLPQSAIRLSTLIGMLVIVRDPYIEYTVYAYATVYFVHAVCKIYWKPVFLALMHTFSPVCSKAQSRSEFHSGPDARCV